MKILTIVVHTSAQQPLADCLRALPQVQSFTFIHAEGHSTHTESDPFLSARDKVVGYVPRVRLDVLLEDADVSAVLDVLITEGDCRGHAVYWVSAVAQSGRL